jgi:hypothetical protein
MVAGREPVDVADLSLRGQVRLLAAKHPLVHGVLMPLTHRLGRARTGRAVQFQLTPLDHGQDIFADGALHTGKALGSEFAS